MQFVHVNNSYLFWLLGRMPVLTLAKFLRKIFLMVERQLKQNKQFVSVRCLLTTDSKILISSTIMSLNAETRSSYFHSDY